MIRELEEADRAQWRALWQHYLDCDGSTLEEAIHESTWTRILSVHETMSGALILAEGEPVGFVHYVFHRSTWSIGDACYLQDLFVEASARGKGYGRALIDHVCRKAASAGSPQVYWQTQGDNAKAIQLYEKVAERSNYIQFRKSVIS